MALNERVSKPRMQGLLYWTLGTALVALLVSVYALLSNDRSGVARTEETSIERINKSGVLRVAYGGFPPYTIVNPNEPDPNKRVSGFTVDMINEIANRSNPKLKIEWYNLNWETFRADMMSGKFDVLADAVYATVPKAQDFRFTEPFSYFGVAAGVVRVDENRFKNFSDLDRSDITIALAEGYVSSDFAKSELEKPKLKLVAVGEDAFSQMDEVLFGRADIALNDIPTVVQYVKAHQGKVKALWVENPPSWAAASFVTRREDGDLNEMLSTSIRIMKADGTLNRLDRKWKSLGYFDTPNLKPGAGLGQTEPR